MHKAQCLVAKLSYAALHATYGISRKLTRMPPGVEDSKQPNKNSSANARRIISRRVSLTDRTRRSLLSVRPFCPNTSPAQAQH